jgi:hypothetical protein
VSLYRAAAAEASEAVRDNNVIGANLLGLPVDGPCESGSVCGIQR